MKPPDQPDFNFSHSRPEGKEWFSIRWLARHWGKSLQHVTNLVDSGEIRTAVDMRGKGARRSDTNIPRVAVLAFLHNRKKQ
jgi:hypothetical protein